MKNILQAVDFLLMSSGKTLIVCHWDTDGVSSAAIFSRILKDNGMSSIGMTIWDKTYRLGEEVVQKIRDERIQNLIITDLAVEASEVDSVVEETGVKCLYVDHHSITQVPKRAIYVNPRQEDPESYIPASALAQMIAQEIGMNFDWIAGLGIIQDRAVDKFKEIFLSLEKKYPEYFPKVVTQESAIKSRYGRYATILNIKMHRDLNTAFSKAFAVLNKATNLKYIDTISEYRYLNEEYLKSKEEFSRLMRDFEEKKDIQEDIIFFEFESEFEVRSMLCTVISSKNPKMIHVFSTVDKNNPEVCKISLRHQSNSADLISLIKKCVSGWDDVHFGGHPRAAGVDIPSEKLKDFKKRFIEVSTSPK